MLALDTRLRPNEEEIAAKVMDGEAIMINLSNGIYYSADKLGGLIWEMVEARYSLAEMVAEITARYDVLPEQAQADIQRFAEELVQEQLVKVSNGVAAHSQNQPPEVQRRLAYESPRINIYRDMADLLALDPPMPGLDDVPWPESTEDASS